MVNVSVFLSVFKIRSFPSTPVKTQAPQAVFVAGRTLSSIQSSYFSDIFLQQDQKHKARQPAISTDVTLFHYNFQSSTVRVN